MVLKNASEARKLSTKNHDESVEKRILDLKQEIAGQIDAAIDSGKFSLKISTSYNDNNLVDSITKWLNINGYKVTFETYSTMFNRTVTFKIYWGEDGDKYETTK
jgi:methyl coenzyme M reductase subunit D